MYVNRGQILMKVIVDSDACPVKNIILLCCKKASIPVIFVHSISHISNQSLDAEVIVVDNSSQAADMEIVKHTSKGDLIVTSDIGLAAIVLGKGAHVLNFSGYAYTNGNIELHLEQRYLNQKILASKGRLKGPSKRTNSDNEAFKAALEKFLLNISS